MTNLTFTRGLPPNFHRQDFFDFHSRDTSALAERCGENVMEKGIIWHASPALIRFDFNNQNHVTVSLEIDTDQVINKALDAFAILAEHMLGLDQDIESFERAVADQDTPFSKLVNQQSGLRIPQSSSVFEAFSWAIIGQQISVKAAISIRQRFIQAFGVRHSSGLLCYPTAESLRNTSPESLQQVGFSKAKANTLLLLSEQICQEILVWPTSLDPALATKLSQQLLALKGIGPWTVSYGLLRGFSWLDGSLHGDVAVRRNLSKLLAEPVPLDAKAVEQWLVGYSPWRALVGAHLWAMDLSSGY